MTDVAKEMGNLRQYLEYPDADCMPVLEWPPYTRYAELHSAVVTLDLAVLELDRQSDEKHFRADLTHRYLAEARDLSLSTSKATIFAMKVMSKKTGEYAQELEDPESPLTVEDITNNAVACEIGKLLEHSTEATESVWAAVDLLQQLHDANTEPQEEQLTTDSGVEGKEETERIVKGTHVKKWSPQDWLTLGCILCCLFLTTLQELKHPSLFISHRAQTDCTVAKTLYADLSHAYKLFHDSYKHSASLQQSQHYKLIMLNERYQNLQGALDDKDLRIDNIWEALGPPNTNGAFYGAESAKALKCDYDSGVDGKLQELRQGLQEQVKRAEASAVQVRREMQLTDIRLSQRLTKIEWKVR
jgi:hypothetical protein